MSEDKPVLIAAFNTYKLVQQKLIGETVNYISCYDQEELVGFIKFVDDFKYFAPSSSSRYSSFLSTALDKKGQRKKVIHAYFPKSYLPDIIKILSVESPWYLTFSESKICALKTQSELSNLPGIHAKPAGE